MCSSVCSYVANSVHEITDISLCYDAIFIEILYLNWSQVVCFDEHPINGHQWLVYVFSKFRDFNIVVMTNSNQFYEGCGQEGPIRCIFLSEFHDTAGSKITCQVRKINENVDSRNDKINDEC